MIERMKKLEVVLQSRDRKDFILDLQRLGLIHLESRPARSRDDTMSAAMARIKDALGWVAAMAKSFTVSMPQAALRETPEELAHRLLAARKRLAELDVELRGLDERIARLRPYGRLDPSVFEQLDHSGLALYLCTTVYSRFHPEGGAAVHVEPLEEIEGDFYFLAMHLKSDTLNDLDQEILTARDNVPLEDLNVLQADREKLRVEQDALIREALDAFRYEDALKHHVTDLSDIVRRQHAEEGLEDALDGVLCVVRGWFPAAMEEQVNEFFRTHDEVYFIDDPGHGDNVPIKLKQTWFTRMFQPIMRVYSLPQYGELDPTSFFAPFYALFFGLCVADGGYAILILGILLFGFSRLRKSKMAPMLGLAAILGVSILVGGIILDDFFGIRPVTEGIPQYAWLTPFAFLRKQTDAMYFPIMLGFIQICLGYVLRTINRIRHIGWTGGLMSLGVLSVIVSIIMLILTAVGPNFTIGPLPIGRLGIGISTTTCLVPLALGLFLILFFNGVESGTKWFKRPLKGLWNLYELVTGLPGDILSYMRLFALGLAGGLLAEAVNEIAFKMVQGSQDPLSYLGMVLVLAFGHGLNLGIGLLSAFVHSLRLTFVEFYKAVEFKGGGSRYDAFRIEAAAAPDFRISMAGRRR
jgi:V/A-type H+/Na+-transporting ATPase subunit I